jgi:uncharacterized protein with von Willebrand factor type A (vWA) domain
LSTLLGDARSGKLPENLGGFGRALRRAGVPVDTSLIRLGLDAVGVVGLERRDDFRSALRSVMVSREQDLHVFDELFEAWFRDPEVARQLLGQMLPKAPNRSEPRRSERAQEALAPPRLGAKPSQPLEDEVRLDAAMSASETQRLRQADFAAMNASEYRLVERLAREIPLELPRIDSRRTAPGSRGPRPHWARTLREAMRSEGELLRLVRAQRRSEPLPVLILVDVSGSMERYARLMLAFLHRATRGRRRAVFAFGTRLTDLNAAFREADPDRMLAGVAKAVQDYAGGTRIGESLAALRQGYPRALVGRRTVVMLITDGLDTGDPVQLDRELASLLRRCRSLLWLNPLLRFDAYQPLAAGARVLHRRAHAMLAVHNLSRLEELAAALARLVATR